MEEKIKKILMELGADQCGIANIERFGDAPAGFHPVDLYMDCKSVIVFAKCMPKGLMEVNPRIMYNKANDMILNELDRICLLACAEIEKLGYSSVPIPSDVPYEYWDGEKLEGRGLISMRHAALLAGIGSMGKNTLIISRKYGNMINIGALLTNLDLVSDPLSEELCISGCRLCLDNCRQKALDGRTVNQKLCRERAYGATKRGFSTCNCNSCRIVCPKAVGERDVGALLNN